MSSPQQKESGNDNTNVSSPTSIRHSIRMIVDQHCNEMKQLADDFGLIYAKDSMCGFIAMAIMSIHADECKNDMLTAEGIMKVLQQHVLPWIVERRQICIDENMDEFVPHGTPYQESHGRMSIQTYKGMMCSTVEIAQYLSLEKWIQIPMKKQKLNDNCYYGFALLRNILEGPPNDNDEKTSIRFPRQEGSFIAQEELEYLQQERPFWKSGEDQYVQVVDGTTGPCRFLSVQDFSEHVIIETVKTNKKWNVIIDTSNCHYHVLRISFERSSNDNISCDSNDKAEQRASPNVMVLEELDSVKRDEDYKSQPCENLVFALRQSWQKL